MAWSVINSIKSDMSALCKDKTLCKVLQNKFKKMFTPWLHLIQWTDIIWTLYELLPLFLYISIFIACPLPLCCSLWNAMMSANEWCVLWHDANIYCVVDINKYHQLCLIYASQTLYFPLSWLLVLNSNYFHS